MDNLSRETDLSNERPSRRSELSPRLLLSDLGGRGPAFSWLRKLRPAARIQPDRITNLPDLEGDPSPRAYLGLPDARAERATQPPARGRRLGQAD
jgi:hypothetical protein